MRPALSPAPAAVLEALSEKIRTRQARLAVVGLGYVGLPLAVAFARKGLDTRNALRDYPGEHIIRL